MSNTPLSWTVEIIEDPDNTGDLILPLPEELLSKMNWKTGDTLLWVDNKDGSWSLSKEEAP